jgi:hypothetical protein
MRLNFGVRRRRTMLEAHGCALAASREGAELRLVRCGGSAAEAPALARECVAQPPRRGSHSPAPVPAPRVPRNSCAPPPQPGGAQPSVAPYQDRGCATVGTPNVGVAADMRHAAVRPC